MLPSRKARMCFLKNTAEMRILCSQSSTES